MAENEIERLKTRGDRRFPLVFYCQITKFHICVCYIYMNIKISRYDRYSICTELGSDYSNQ